MVVGVKMRMLHASRRDALAESRGLDQIRKALFATKGSAIGVNTAKSESSETSKTMQGTCGMDVNERESTVRISRDS